jgi:hypothetical protein
MLSKTLLLCCAILGLAGILSAAEMQGVIVDWNCVDSMVHNGRENTLKNNRSCSLMKNYQRAAYGLITSDNAFYRLEDPGNARILEMLRNTPDKDDLKVVVSGDIDGNTIKVANISEL